MFDGKIFAAKIIKKAKLEENKYKDKFVVSINKERRVLIITINLLTRQCSLTNIEYWLKQIIQMSFIKKKFFKIQIN